MACPSAFLGTTRNRRERGGTLSGSSDASGATSGSVADRAGPSRLPHVRTARQLGFMSFQGSAPCVPCDRRLALSGVPGLLPAPHEALMANSYKQSGLLIQRAGCHGMSAVCMAGAKQ